jgi:hypothetical protein
VLAGGTDHFLVGELQGHIVRNESFVLPLTEQEDIDYARYLISRTQSGFAAGDRTIVVADVAAAKSDINRNYLEPRFPRWSWQIDRFVGFAEIIAEGMETWPGALESILWDHSDSRTITVGFTDLCVLKELGPIPLYLSILSETDRLEFYWSGVGTNHVYTLEGKQSPAGTNWFPLPGADWPLKTNHWTLPRTNVTAGFYRVRADSSND